MVSFREKGGKGKKETIPRRRYTSPVSIGEEIATFIYANVGNVQQSSLFPRMCGVWDCVTRGWGWVGGGGEPSQDKRHGVGGGGKRRKEEEEEEGVVTHSRSARGGGESDCSTEIAKRKLEGGISSTPFFFC